MLSPQGRLDSACSVILWWYSYPTCSQLVSRCFPNSDIEQSLAIYPQHFFLSSKIIFSILLSHLMWLYCSVFFFQNYFCYVSYADSSLFFTGSIFQQLSLTFDLNSGCRDISFSSSPISLTTESVWSSLNTSNKESKASAATTISSLWQATSNSRVPIFYYRKGKQ